MTAAGASGKVGDVDEKNHIIVRTDADEKKIFNFVFKDKYVTDFLTFEDSDILKKLEPVIKEHREKAQGKGCRRGSCFRDTGGSRRGRGDPFRKKE